MALKKVSYGTTKIQKLRRIALDQSLLETLGLSIGDVVRVELDTEQEAVLITRGPPAVPPESIASPSTRRRSAKG